MPIRMTEDPSSGGSNNRRSSGGRGFSGGGGGGGLISLLFSFLPFLLRRPKLLIAVIIIGGGLYFFLGRTQTANLTNAVMSSFGTGATLDQKVFDEADVFEPLSPEGNTLPERVSLEKYCPKRMNQGQQGSCVGWGSSYAARTILQSIAANKNPNDVAFSPSFLYNQIKLDGCNGSYINRAMESLTSVGDLPFSNFGYTEDNCNRQPTNDELAAAARYKMKGANRLTKSGDDYTIDLLAIKQNLAQGAPVVIGMMVGGSFMQDMVGQKVWIPTDNDYNMRGFGGHCMCVIGYDDYLEGGAFQLMNSWGPEWGENGIAWVRYADFNHFTKEAYGVYPMAKIDKGDQKTLQVQFGLVDNNTKKLIPFRSVSDNVFRTTQAIHAGDKFKIQVTNNAECYTYVFGQETDGSTYTLFPYTPKHSPYCGIVGTRVFPKDYSMEADNKGTVDVMAVVITRQPIDYTKLQKAISASKAKTYEGKLREVLQDEWAEVTFAVQGDQISFTGDAEGKNAVAVVLEIEKQ